MFHQGIVTHHMLDWCSVLARFITPFGVWNLNVVIFTQAFQQLTDLTDVCTESTVILHKFSNFSSQIALQHIPSRAHQYHRHNLKSEWNSFVCTAKNRNRAASKQKKGEGKLQVLDNIHITAAKSVNVTHLIYHQHSHGLKIRQYINWGLCLFRTPCQPLYIPAKHWCKQRLMQIQESDCMQRLKFSGDYHPTCSIVLQSIFRTDPTWQNTNEGN